VNNYTFKLLPGQYAMCKFASIEEAQKARAVDAFFSLTVGDDEISVICLRERAQNAMKTESGWRVLQMVGQLNFTTVGIMASVTKALADNDVSLTAISTYDTDYFMVKEASIEKASEALRQAGHIVLKSDQ
tara:strand:+ start:706 stop:1098 length:393 start_codon:yes stop_codon:yes gene_type:complete